MLLFEAIARTQRPKGVSNIRCTKPKMTTTNEWYLDNNLGIPTVGKGKTRYQVIAGYNYSALMYLSGGIVY